MFIKLTVAGHGVSTWSLPHLFDHNKSGNEDPTATTLFPMPFLLSPKAYAKLIFHCSKYPQRAVNGVLIGAISKKDNNVLVQDAVPLFHLDLALAPMLEVALAQVGIAVVIDSLTCRPIPYVHVGGDLC